MDSTRLVETLGDTRAAEVGAAHDRVARDLLPLHGGREIDKTDGFLLLFDSAEAAVAYAVAYHEAIGRLDPPLVARAGIHRGEVVLRDNPADHVARGAKPVEVEGLAKPIAARVMSLAAGGQTLLTDPARAALGTATAVSSHGHYRMKGVAEPFELFEVDTGRALVPPPNSAKVWRVVRRNDAWVAAEPPPHHLPAERDAFVGRDADLALLSRLIDDGARSISVLGIGGTGKTRLVTRFAWSWLGQWPGGAWFADLSEARSVDGICHGLAQALDVPLSAGDAVSQLGHALAARGRCLVVLDNFEQVTAFAPQTLGRWLDRAPEACFVVTSREVLGLAGEQALPLAPLVDEEALALFATRAAQVRPGFAVGSDERSTVLDLVRLLDHLPLAIELAAARVRVMPPAGLLERMDQRFRLLAGGRGRRDRQSTLRAAIDWSWDLLSGDEQAALAQISVFEGGFDLAAAEAVLALDDLWPMDAVQSLVEKSLVRQVDDERFDLLVSVQEYAAEKLDALGQRVDVERRHADHYGSLGTAETLDALDRLGTKGRLDDLARELDNLVAAGRRAVERGDVERGYPIALAVAGVLNIIGPVGVARRLLDDVLAITPEDAPSWHVLMAELGRTMLKDKTSDAGPILKRAIAAAEARGDRLVLAWATHRFGGVSYRRVDAETKLEHHLRALELFTELGNEPGQVSALAGCVAAGFLTGDFGRSLAYGQRALALCERADCPRYAHFVYTNVANVLVQRGDMETATELHLKAVELARASGERLHLGHVYANTAAAFMHAGRHDEARELLEVGQALCAEVGDRNGEILARSNLAYSCQLAGQPEEALERYERCLEIAEELGDPMAIARTKCSVGQLRAELGRLEEGRAAFQAGARSLRELGARPALAEWMAEWLPHELRFDRAAGLAMLEEVESLVVELEMTETSATVRFLQEARSLA